jgi:hypothetical protein
VRKQKITITDDVGNSSIGSQNHLTILSIPASCTSQFGLLPLLAQQQVIRRTDGRAKGQPLGTAILATRSDKEPDRVGMMVKSICQVQARPRAETQPACQRWAHRLHGLLTRSRNLVHCGGIGASSRGAKRAVHQVHNAAFAEAQHTGDVPICFKQLRIRTQNFRDRSSARRSNPGERSIGPGAVSKAGSLYRDASQHAGPKLNG